MKKAIVLSMPHSGTHFTCKLLQAMEIPVEFAHFQPTWVNAIEERLMAFDRTKEFVVVPYRPLKEVRQTWVDRARPSKLLVTLGEYYACHDVQDYLQSLLDDVGFVLLPIKKSPLRFDYAHLIRSAAMKEGNAGQEFILNWKPEKGMKNELHKFTLKETRDES